MKKALLVLLILTTAFCAFAEEKPLLTVLDFVGSGVSEQERMIIVDFISSHIVSSGMYRVIDRMQREAILKELEFSYSGCTDESCQLEVGKMLQAERIIVGSLGKVSTLYILNMKLIEVETGETILTGSKQYTSMEALINDSQNLTIGFLGADAPGETVEITETPAKPAAEEAPAEEDDNSLDAAAEEAIETALAVEAEKEAEREAEKETEPVEEEPRAPGISTGLWRLDLGVTSRVIDMGDTYLSGDSLDIADYAETPLPSIGVSADLFYSLTERLSVGLGIGPSVYTTTYIENGYGQEILIDYISIPLDFRLKVLYELPWSLAFSAGLYYSYPLWHQTGTTDYVDYETGSIDTADYSFGWGEDEEIWSGFGISAGIYIRDFFMNVKIGVQGSRFMSYYGDYSLGLEAGYSLQL